MQQELDKKILSDITIYAKYARYLPEQQRRETWDEIVDRNIQMHSKKYPQLAEEIKEVYERSVRPRKLLPSARSLQFAGRAIDVNPCRIYNCCYEPIDHPAAFSEASFLLLGGTGFGYSVQKRHISKLPPIIGVDKPTGKQSKKRYLIGDCIEGWSDAFKVLVESYFYGKRELDFDYREVRKKGTRLVVAGGKAPGPEPLRKALTNVIAIFETALQERGSGTQLTSLEVHDIICTIADAVRSGGIRRSACICLFDNDDEKMLSCKKGEWWVHHPQRALANNSAIMPYADVTQEKFQEVWKAIEISGSGEPGISWTNNPDWGYNPCQPAWAKVLTPSGLSTMGEIKVGDLIWSNEGWTTVRAKWSTGVKQVKRYETTSSVFYGTGNHKVVSNGKKIEADKANSIDSIPGYYTNVKHNPQDIMDGLVIGDGTVHKASNDLVLLCIGGKDYDYQKSEVGSLIKKPRPGIGPYIYEIETSVTAEELPHTYERRVPGRFFNSQDKMAGFLKGLYSANGSVVRNRVTLKTTSKGMVEDIQLMLSALGIKSYYTTNKPTAVKFKNGTYTCKESYDINISTHSARFMSIIGFLQDYKVEKLKNKRNTEGKVAYNIVNVSNVSVEEVFDITVDNNSHTYWTQGCNVSNCHEVALKPFSFCNLCEINGSIIKTQEEFNQIAKDASFIGTLQAGYTNFHYLRPIWKETTEEDALIGVGITGVATASLLELDEQLAAEVVILENERVASIIGINKAQRTTVVKPAGTTSLLFACSSGIHAWHNDYYIRRITLGKDEAIAKFLMLFHPELIEESEYDSKEIKVCVPQKAPDGAMLRTENVIDTLERVKRFNINWVQAGHVGGDNFNNVSTTISVKDDEWKVVGEWMWENRKNYLGIAVLPYNGGSYRQAPFQDISKEDYEGRVKNLITVDLSTIIETDDETDLAGEVTCGGGACEIK